MASDGAGGHEGCHEGCLVAGGLLSCTARGAQQETHTCSRCATLAFMSLSKSAAGPLGYDCLECDTRPRMTFAPTIALQLAWSGNFETIQASGV